IKMLLFLLFGVWHGLFSSRGCDGENNERLYSLRQGEATGRLQLIRDSAYWRGLANPVPLNRIETRIAWLL
uniref:hypothetical protein n=1 Tax=Serratia microhaemolytica TaxID=2675110 RepID=UPI00197D63A0